MNQEQQIVDEWLFSFFAPFVSFVENHHELDDTENVLGYSKTAHAEVGLVWTFVGHILIG